MKKLMNFLMLSCIKATELVEKKLENGLSFTQKTQLYLHTRMCDACRLYEQQSKFIDVALRKHSEVSLENRSQEQLLSKEIKEKIIRNIE